MSDEIKVGSKCWRKSSWRSSEREELEVVGETSRSWLVAPVGFRSVPRMSFKVPKKRGPSRGLCHTVYFSVEEFDNAKWCEDNAWKIGGAVQGCRDYATLRKIADMIRFEVQV